VDVDIEEGGGQRGAGIVKDANLGGQLACLPRRKGGDPAVLDPDHGVRE
jgi:hypothetical protein